MCKKLYGVKTVEIGAALSEGFHDFGDGGIDGAFKALRNLSETAVLEGHFELSAFYRGLIRCHAGRFVHPGDGLFKVSRFLGDFGQFFQFIFVPQRGLSECLKV